MARPRSLFRQRDVTRLLRAYDVAGQPQPTLHITKDGDLIAVPAANDANESGIGDHAGRHRERAVL
jgi:hypothetical protein